MERCAVWVPEYRYPHALLPPEREVTVAPLARFEVVLLPAEQPATTYPLSLEHDKELISSHSLSEYLHPKLRYGEGGERHF